MEHGTPGNPPTVWQKGQQHRRTRSAAGDTRHLGHTGGRQSQSHAVKESAVQLYKQHPREKRKGVPSKALLGGLWPLLPRSPTPPSVLLGRQIAVHPCCGIEFRSKRSKGWCKVRDRAMSQMHRQPTGRLQPAQAHVQGTVQVTKVQSQRPHRRCSGLGQRKQVAKG